MCWVSFHLGCNTSIAEQSPERVGPCAGVPPQPANFSAFLNGEPVRNQDLVNWVTVGAFDVPTSESAPITSVAGRRLAFWLLPYNYFDEVQIPPFLLFIVGSSAQV